MNKIEKYQKGKALINGIKWLINKGDDVGRVVKSANTVNKLNRWSPGLMTGGGGVVGGLAGYGTGLLIDDQYGTNIAPWMALGGAGLGAGLVARSSPVMMRRMMNNASKLDWTQQGVTIPNDYPKWKWASSGSYQDGVVRTPLFARKSQLAHELGHYVGDKGVADPSTVMGAFSKGYLYSPNVSPEVNAAENFADYFKTRIGYPYKGSDANLLSRQRALQNDTWFGPVTNPLGRVYERALPDFMPPRQMMGYSIAQMKDLLDFVNRSGIDNLSPSTYHELLKLIDNANIGKHSGSSFVKVANMVSKDLLNAGQIKSVPLNYWKTPFDEMMPYRSLGHKAKTTDFFRLSDSFKNGGKLNNK